MLIKPNFLTVFAAVLFATSGLRAVEITVEGGSVVVAAGKSEVLGQAVSVAQKTVLSVEAAPILEARDEALVLSVDKPAGFSDGTRLKAVKTHDVNARGALVKGSLEIRRSKGGDLLKEGDDYLVDSDWAHVGLGPKTQVTVKDTVYASYQYSKLRLDTVQVSAAGAVTLKKGEPHISVPVPPVADAGQVAVAHVFVSYSDTEAKADQIYPILESASQAVTGSTAGRIPKTLAKLKAGQPVKIVSWGDSVTGGGNASKPEFRYVDVFAAGLKTRFPQAQIDVQNISAGGSNSRQWLSPEQYPYGGLTGDANPARFENVINAKPDLVTIEFVNDAPLKPEQVEVSYNEILSRLPAGTEVILITPHYTMWSMMGFSDMRGVEKRPYMLALREFATKKNIALADASARWEHLWKEGLPYLTLLDNTINHPDDRGHRLFAEELWKCFE